MRFSLSVAAVIAAIVVLLAVLVISAVFFRRSLYSMAFHSGEDLFRIAGLLYLIGAILIIALGLGALIIMIAYLILAVAFLTVKPKPASLWSSHEFMKS